MQHDYHNHYGYPSSASSSSWSSLLSCLPHLLFAEFHFVSCLSNATFVAPTTLRLAQSVCMFVCLSARLPVSLCVTLSVSSSFSSCTENLLTLWPKMLWHFVCVACAFAPWWYCSELFLLQHVIHTNKVMHTAHNKASRAICKTLEQFEWPRV